MIGSEGESTPPVDPATTESPPAGPAYLPFGAYAAPSVLTAPRPPWTRTYELPSARRVVSVGLQLALGSSVAIRRASIYIGLLALGAFGPAALLILVGLARLLSDPATAATLNGDNPMAIFLEQPDLGDPLTLIAGVALAGLVLLVAISIDAKAIAIAMLAGAYSERPMSLPEALARARQTFWRLLWSGLLVGVVSSVISLVLAWPFLRPFDSNQGVTFITSMIATLAVTPFAFASTGIVLGDAGAIETLRRSVRLFRAKPRIALVVTLFTLVSAAIQSFAFGGGADLASRVATFFHVGEGAASLILPGLLVLALIVAFGSLTFTIAAIVAAPQVAAFLGLTFYSGGLDQARDAAGAPRARVRWVSIPMAIVMVGLGVVFVLGIPMITSFQPRAASPLLEFMRNTAEPQGMFVSTVGQSTSTEDRSAEVDGLAGTSADILVADYGYLPEVPAWLLNGVFDCLAPGVTCARDRSDRPMPYQDGALIFVQRMAASPPRDGRGREWGATLRLEGADVPARAGVAYPDASDVVITRFAGDDHAVMAFHWASYIDRRAGTFQARPTEARSLWVGADLVTMIPFSELQSVPTSWDTYSYESSSVGSQHLQDSLLEDGHSPMLEFLDPPFYVFVSRASQP